MIEIDQIKVGDRIKFRSPTRSGNKAVWRVVNGHWPDTKWPTVRFDGWNDFVVRPHEIIDHIEAGQ